MVVYVVVTSLLRNVAFLIYALFGEISILEIPVVGNCSLFAGLDPGVFLIPENIFQGKHWDLHFLHIWSDMFIFLQFLVTFYNFWPIFEPVGNFCHFWSDQRYPMPNPDIESRSRWGLLVHLTT